MQAGTFHSFRQYLLPGLLISAAFTVVIGLTAANLSGFQIVGQTGIAFYYPWQLAESNVLARLTAWTGYLLHNIIAWFIIYFAHREKPKFGNNLHWFNWAMIANSFGLCRSAHISKPVLLRWTSPGCAGSHRSRIRGADVDYHHPVRIAAARLDLRKEIQVQRWVYSGRPQISWLSFCMGNNLYVLVSPHRRHLGT